MRSTLIIFLFVAFNVATAQQSNASYEFFNTLSDCPVLLGGWKCLELDLSSETAEATDTTNRKKFEYSWTLGDGTRKQGEKIEHCYGNYGSYQVKMDLIDPETNTVIRNDLSATAYIFPEIRPVIEASTSEDFSSSYEFNAVYNDGDLFVPDHVFWRIDGRYYEGKKVSHTFHQAGTFVVEMVIVKDTELTGTLTACSTKEITIKESDIWTSGLVEHFEKTREQYKSGPFAKSDVFCLLTTNNESAIIPLRFLMNDSRLKENHEYKVLLFSGNLFTDIKQIKTDGLNGHDLLSALKDTVSSFAKATLHSLPPLAIDNSSGHQYNMDAIAHAAKALSQIPLLKVQIGTYVHTGSRAEKGIQESLQRASTIKLLLIQNGVAESRLTIASPENNLGLFNTCSGFPGCDWENAALNNKVELKITGLAL